MAKIKFEKLDLQTADLSAINIEKIGAIFPNVIIEYETDQGDIKKGVDFELLQQLLSKELVDGTKEKYQLNWPGKKAALLKANTPITETLRPDIANSKNWDKTENIFIEGDNFTALKILQESYLGKIKMIYIDPPYNTGKDFVYSDKFTIDKSEYAEKIGQYDEENNKLFKENTRTNPRYHSDWLSMMYERLHIARDLLREDGVIFISIDDNEVHNLRKICDEIFGEENFVACLVQKARGGISNDKIISNNHNYVLMYSKFYEKIHNLRKQFGILRTEVDFKTYNKDDGDGKGVYTLNPVTGPGGARKGNPFYEILGVENYWRYGKETMHKLIENGKIIKVNENLYQKTYRKDLESTKKGASTWLDKTGTTQEGTFEIKNLFDEETVFDFPKPTRLIRFLLEFINYSPNDVILDFFAGSGTTAHAVMSQNAEDGGNRKFIMVQLDEETDEKSEAYKAGYKTIAELSRERIRRAGEKILVENKDKLATRETELDIGFRAFRVDSTNMKDVYYHPKDLKQDNLLDLVDTIKADRTPEDLLIQVLLDKALTLDLPIKTQKFKNNTVYIVGDNDLIVCMDTVLDADIIDDLAQLGADTAVFRDSSFATEADRIKLETHFKRLSPRDTKILVI